MLRNQSNIYFYAALLIKQYYVVKGLCKHIIVLGITVCLAFSLCVQRLTSVTRQIQDTTVNRSVSAKTSALSVRAMMVID